MHVQSLLMAQGTAPFTPTDIAGCRVWLKADSLSLNDGDPVSTWADQSGNGNNFTGSGTARPTYKTGIVNGKPVVRGDGSNDVMTSSYTTPSAHTMFVVYNRSTLSPLGDNPNAAGGPLWRSTRLWVNVAAGTFADLSSTAFTGAWSYIAIRASGSINGVWLNATSIFSSATNSTAAAGTVALFRSFDGFSSSDIAEVIIYDSALSTTDRQRVQAYLAAKYAI